MRNILKPIISWIIISGLELHFKFLPPKQNIAKPRLIWGTNGIITNKYWSLSMTRLGYYSKTLVQSFNPSINKFDDFDYYVDDIFLEKKLLVRIHNLVYRLFKVDTKLKEFISFYFIIRNFDILHTSFDDTIFNHAIKSKRLWELFKRSNTKLITIPFGGDYQVYSEIQDISLRAVLLMNYPELSMLEDYKRSQIKFHIKNSNFIMAANQVDSISRWDIMPSSINFVDTEQWTPKTGEVEKRSKQVNIAHTPNHRYIKGTEYILEAVDRLKKEGFEINLILIEGKSNDEVKDILTKHADILVEQIIVGYALSGVEGMASGIPVVSNLEIERYTRAFRRYSYLDECPILSATPESIYKTLKLLVCNPELRQELGTAGVKYAKKYHSLDAAGKMFQSIYNKVYFGHDINLLDYFHPKVKSSYNNSAPTIKHPLIENKLPKHSKYWKSIK